MTDGEHGGVAGLTGNLTSKWQSSTRVRALWNAYVRLAPTATVVLAVVWLVKWVELLQVAIAVPGSIGIDHRTAMDGAQRWLDTGTPFLVRQLQGPYVLLGSNTVDSGEFLYPPLVLPLFAAFTVLPAVLWWLVPGALVGLALVRHPPARWSWPIIVLLLMATSSQPLMIQGNPVIWLAPVVLWGRWLGWPSPLVLLKPTLFPFALIGIRRKAWWVMFAILVVAAVPFGMLWAQWMAVLLDTQQAQGVAYNSGQVAFLLAFAVAGYAGRRDESRIAPSVEFESTRR